MPVACRRVLQSGDELGPTEVTGRAASLLTLGLGITRLLDSSQKAIYDGS
ncbi:hypothetical protein THTE_2827 [Thermogutta terrifontis]|uniref:Uncharacterized protein n=1 Tax=Thermogutta terrifontis TaxID=1331910 RepID=A0A286RHJ5_9BACT|nr:hypothetical protein THTE_2827 [Thermogutta terrifontis]